MKIQPRPILLSLLFSSFLFSYCHAQAEEVSVQTPWKVEDVVFQERAGGFEISPSGDWVVWTKTAADKEKDGYITHIFLSSLGETTETLQLTRGDDSEFRPKWSPSGKVISFVTGRKTKEQKDETFGGQVWFMDLRGGEPWAVTGVQTGVTDYDWIDEDHLLLVARENLTLVEQRAKEKKDTAFVAEDQDHMPAQRLFLLDVKEKKMTRLTSNNDQIVSFELSHNKKWVLTQNNQSVRYIVDKKIKPKFFLFNLEDKTSIELFPDPTFKPTMFAWAMDDQGFYFSHLRTSDYENESAGAEFLYYYHLESRKYVQVPLDWDWGLFQGFQVRDNGFVVWLANGARPKWRRYTRTGDTYIHKDLEGKQCPNIYGLYLQRRGNTAVFSYTTASTPGQWFYGTLENHFLEAKRPFTDLNPHFKNKTLAKTEVIRWIGALNEEVEGILYYPHDFKPGKRYPLILSIHGGPTGVDMDAFEESWASYPNIIAQKGAFVFMPNYHGSGGYGQMWAESIKGHYYEYEIPDIMNGIDSLIKKGLVDTDRLGTMGWSNGGILTIGLSVWTNRFKVAGVGAADVNWISDYGNCMFGVSFDNYYFTGAPWDKLDHYIKKSPLFHLKEMRVPTIIFHGTEDVNVPYEQGWEYYRALQQTGKAPVRFIVFPGEPHGLGKLTHQQRKMEEEIAWFEKHFFKSEPAENEAFKKGSPLDLAIKMQGFAREGQFYGRSFKGALIPEVVRIEGLEAGRFEVTRAQWASFDKNFKIEPGTDNYPMNNITFEQAQKYVHWLKELTGEDFRLPSMAEAEKLAKKGGTNDNNFDYWAGYPLNPDDAKILLQKVKNLNGTAPLLLPVDKFAGVGDELVYGLGGSVAEWAVDGKGLGKVIGQWATSHPDPMGASSEAPAEYIGLRVVKGK